MVRRRGRISKIDLNEASKSDLVRLPGIGDKRAEQILAHRGRVGGFRCVRDLYDIEELPRSAVERIIPYVEVRGERGPSDCGDEPAVRAIEIMGQINVNEATVEDFLLLPGLGKKKAIAIVEYVKEHGPITRKKQLLNVPGVGESLLRTISPNIKLKGKSNARIVSVKEIPPPRVSEMMVEIERKQEELKKVERILKEDGKIRTRNELIALFTDIVNGIKENMEQISKNIIEETSAGLDVREFDLARKEEDLRRREEDLARREMEIADAASAPVSDTVLREIEERERALQRTLQEIGKRERALEKMRSELEGREAEIEHRIVEMDRRERELEALKEELLKREVAVIIDEAKYEEFTRKERELAEREIRMNEREREIGDLKEQLERQLAERSALLDEIERKEELLVAREEELRQMERDLTREEQQKREELIRKEVELMVREVEVEEVNRRQEELAGKEEELERREETLKIWEENLRMRENALAAGTVETAEGLPDPGHLAFREERLAEREAALQVLKADLDRRERDLVEREAEVRRRTVELALREARLEDLEKRDAELRFKIKAFQERQKVFMVEVSSIVKEAKRIRDRLEAKKVDLMAREAVLKKAMGEGV